MKMLGMFSIPLNWLRSVKTKDYFQRKIEISLCKAQLYQHVIFRKYFHSTKNFFVSWILYPGRSWWCNFYSCCLSKDPVKSVQQMEILQEKADLFVNFWRMCFKSDEKTGWFNHFDWFWLSLSGKDVKDANLSETLNVMFYSYYDLKGELNGDTRRLHR